MKKQTERSLSICCPFGKVYSFHYDILGWKRANIIHYWYVFKATIARRSVGWLDKATNMYAINQDRSYVEKKHQFVDVEKLELDFLGDREVALVNRVSVSSFIKCDELENSLMVTTTVFQYFYLDTTCVPYIRGSSSRRNISRIVIVGWLISQ